MSNPQSDKPFDQQADTGAKEKAAVTKDAATSEAKSVAQDAKAGGQQVAGTAKAEAQQVAGQAKNQAMDLLHTVRGEVSSQAGGQTQRLAGSVRTIADELREMAQGSQQGGVAAGLAAQAGDQLHAFAGQLEGREPAELLDDVRRFARRRPGAFLAGAAVLGLVGGRLTRGLTAEDPAEKQRRAYVESRPRSAYAQQRSQETYPQAGSGQGFGPAYTETVEPGTYGAPVATGETSRGQGYSTQGSTDRIEVVGEPHIGTQGQRVSDEGPLGKNR